jgi:hypothetical protein
MPILCAMLFASAIEAADAPLDARELMKRSIEAGERNDARANGYLSRSKVIERQLNGDGTVKSEESKTYEAELVDGRHVRRLIAKNDQPLSAEDTAKESERIAARKRQKTADHKKNSDKKKELTHQILDAFDFKLAGEETIDGRKNWIIEATSKPGYKPVSIETQMLAHLTGKVWIDEDEYIWTKADAVASEPIAFGFGMIAKLDRGAHLYFRQMRLEDGVWVQSESGIRAVMHVAMVKRIAIDQVTRFENYRKAPAGAEVGDSRSN